MKNYEKLYFFVFNRKVKFLLKILYLINPYKKKLNYQKDFK